MRLPALFIFAIICLTPGIAQTTHVHADTAEKPALESLGYAAIRAGKWDAARDAFRQVLAARPKSGFGYYGIALAYEKEGNRSAASKAYEEFLDSWKYADEDLEMVRAARAARSRQN